MRWSSPPQRVAKAGDWAALSQENVELVRESIAAVPDWHEVSALLHPDARFAGCGSLTGCPDRAEAPADMGLAE